MENQSNSFIDEKGNISLLTCSHNETYEAYSFEEECLMEICKDCIETTRKV